MTKQASSLLPRFLRVVVGHTLTRSHNNRSAAHIGTRGRSLRYGLKQRALCRGTADLARGDLVACDMWLDAQQRLILTEGIKIH